MADMEATREDVYDPEVDNDPNTIRDMGTEKEENERFQTYFQPTLYPPGYVRNNTQENYVEVQEQPPVSLRTGFQCVASSGRVLFAANGPDIHSFHILEKTHLSTWRWPKEKNFPKIPEALKTIHDPNLPAWVPQPGEKTKQKKAQKKDGRNDTSPAKRRKLNLEEEDSVLEPSSGVGKPDNDSVNGDNNKAASSEDGADQLQPFPPRHTNPQLWQSNVVEKEGIDQELPTESGEIIDVDKVKYEESSKRPPDVKPEGWTVDQKENWRRPEFRPERRLDWKHQPSTTTSDIPMVQCLSVTADGKHVVAVTGSDKTIWVFEHDGSGKLNLLSQRTVPKRPNAIAFANKDRTLLCADKFGDVYALPLIERKDVPLKPTASLLSRSATPATAKPFTSQANEKTVHSKRNLAALENQKKQLEKEGSSTPKINPRKDPAGDFYHKLILGHVSMLTDLAVGRVTTVDPHSGKTFKKELIITADRDEHIRVSRGIPQSHVIENFLLGHKEFVSRIHVPERFPNILVSGGGDSYIFFWDFVTGKLLFKQDIRADLVKKFDADTAGEPPLAVSGITSYYDHIIGQTRVFLICENIPNLFMFNLDKQMLGNEPVIDRSRSCGTIALAGNPLSITTFAADESQGVIVTYDPWTAGTTIYLHSHSPFIQVIVPTGLTTEPKVEEVTVPDECSEEIAFTFRGDWEKALYTIEPLRKNCFDRDISMKDERGNPTGATTSTG